LLLLLILYTSLLQSESILDSIVFISIIIEFTLLFNIGQYLIIKKKKKKKKISYRASISLKIFHSKFTEEKIACRKSMFPIKELLFFFFFFFYKKKKGHLSGQVFLNPIGSFRNIATWASNLYSFMVRTSLLLSESVLNSILFISMITVFYITIWYWTIFRNYNKNFLKRFFFFLVLEK